MISFLFQKFIYKIVFVLSIIFSLFALFGLVGATNTLVQSYQHGLLSVVDLFGFIFSLGLLLGFISSSAIVYSYTRNIIQSNWFSDICVLTIGVILVLVLVFQGFIFALMVLSGGIFALIPGITSIIPSPVGQIATVLCFFAYLGLLSAFTREHKVNRIRVFTIWLIVLIIIISWSVPRFVKNNTAPLKSAVTVSTSGSIVDWTTFENLQAGISFKHPSSWPTPYYYGINGHGSPNITVQESHQPIILDIEIGQNKSDGRTCDSCVPMTLDETVRSLGSYLTVISPNYKSSVINLNGKTYAMFTGLTLYDFVGSAIIIVPNSISPNDFAVITSYGHADLDSLYLLADSFRFSDSKNATADWKIYKSGVLGLSIKYPNDGSYTIEAPETDQVTITQEHPGNRIHIRTTDSNSVEGAYFTPDEIINNQTFRKFNYEGMGFGYGYMIKHNDKNYVFESVWGPTNDIFELMMTSFRFE